MYYQVEALKEIGSTIRPVLRIDTHTALESRGRYARICVQINVEKPPITTLLIGNFEQPVIYEGIHKLCFSCGRIEHRKEACPHIIRPTQPPCKEETEEVDKTQSSPCKRHTADSAMDKHPGTNMDQDDQYGLWMVVSRKKNVYKSTRYSKSPSVSRYSKEGPLPIEKDSVRGSKRKVTKNQVTSGP